MSAWVLPDHLADVLPSEARRIEELRRLWLDTARGFGYELVMPPLVEHIESLLTGTGSALDLQTFKLVDQLSGRMLGVRADTTPQVARIDAHLLNRSGLTRLCYCGSVLHTRPDGPFATREPLQLGAELYGHSGLEADLEILELALQGLKASGVEDVLVDFGHSKIIQAILATVKLADGQRDRIHTALAAKDSAGLQPLLSDLPPAHGRALQFLIQAYGGADMLNQARHELSDWPQAMIAIDELMWLASHLQVKTSFDLADVRGYTYYSGSRFAIYAGQGSDALVRGGRYDEVGAVFGRSRSAVGFSLDLKNLVTAASEPGLHPAIRAPWGENLQLRQTIAQLRSEGHTVVCVLPGHESEVDEFHCDRELVLVAGQWAVRPL
jgi:ATP phosphoribosyltransferase regulatory subunit